MQWIDAQSDVCSQKAAVWRCTDSQPIIGVGHLTIGQLQLVLFWNNLFPTMLDWCKCDRYYTGTVQETFTMCIRDERISKLYFRWLSASAVRDQRTTAASAHIRCRLRSADCPRSPRNQDGGYTSIARQQLSFFRSIFALLGVSTGTKMKKIWQF